MTLQRLGRTAQRGGARRAHARAPHAHRQIGIAASSREATLKAGLRHFVYDYWHYS
jgi:hypothetical protein